MTCCMFDCCNHFQLTRLIVVHHMVPVGTSRRKNQITTLEGAKYILWISWVSILKTLPISSFSGTHFSSSWRRSGSFSAKLMFIVDFSFVWRYVCLSVCLSFFLSVCLFGTRYRSHFLTIVTNLGPHMKSCTGKNPIVFLGQRSNN